MIQYIFSLIIITAIWTLFAQSYNLSFGLTGLFNLGHVIFYGIGAYTAAILNTRYGWGFFENLGAAAIVSGIFAAGFGILTLRLSGHYLAIATLGAAMISIVVATNWVSLTNGPLGIRGIDEPEIFGHVIQPDSLSFVLLSLFVVIVGNYLLYKLFHSPFGRMLRAIKDDDIATQAVGKNTFKAKMWSLILSAAFAGIAGAIYSHYRLFLDPTIFSLPVIILVILMVVVGGRGNFWGTILGTILVLPIIGEIPRFIGFPDSIIGASRNMLYAALLIGTMFWKPKGLFTFFEKK